ncbi:MAG: universal stress protein [Bacteroidetes bacterium]|nr:universal stress protein [Bacteroidota bacterium]
MKKILVPVDFSDMTTDVLIYAIRLAKENNASIVVLHVASPNPIYSGADTEPPLIQTYMAEELTREQGELDAIVAHIKSQDIEAYSILLQGPIIDTIMDEANEIKADMIIMGKESHGLLYRTLLGTTSEGVIRRTHIPVLIIPEK